MQLVSLQLAACRQVLHMLWLTHHNAAKAKISHVQTGMLSEHASGLLVTPWLASTPRGFVADGMLLPIHDD